MQLHVVVNSYEDCFYLLDDRFNRLNTFYATICSSNVPMLPVINNKVSDLHLYFFDKVNDSYIHQVFFVLFSRKNLQI